MPRIHRLCNFLTPALNILKAPHSTVLGLQFGLTYVDLLGTHLVRLSVHPRVHSVILKIMERLITRNEFAKRLSCSKALVYKHTKDGGKLHHCMKGKKIDLSQKDIQDFCAEYNYAEPDAAIRAKSVLAGAKKMSSHNNNQRKKEDDIEIPFDHDPAMGIDEQTPATAFINMTLGDLVERYGTTYSFRELASAVKTLVQVRGYEDEQARRRGEYVHNDIMLKVVAMVDSLQKMILADGVVNIVNTAMVMTKNDSTKQEIERVTRDTLSRIIKTNKLQITRNLRKK